MIGRALGLGMAAALVAAPAVAASPAPAGLRPASALLLFERDTGTVLYARHANEQLQIASLTKLMTAYVTVERLPVGAVLTEQPYSATPGESLAHVPPGTRLGLTDLLRAMLLPSGNDVATSVAIDVGGSVAHFVSLMNWWASLLKLGRTGFTTPVGLDKPPGNHSTAFDLARLANVLMRDPLVDNRNDLLLHYDWVVGVKTGYTVNSGYCMVGAALLGGVHVLSVVLGAPSVAARDADTLALLRYGLERYRRAVIARAGQLFARLAVAGHPRRRVRILAARGLALVLPRSVRLHAALLLPARLTGPLAAGAVVGRIVVREDGRVRARVRLVTASAVPAPPPPVRHSREWIVWSASGGALVATLAGCSLTFMRRRARRSAAVPVPR